VRRSGALAPLRHRQFALFWSGALVSNVGTWMETVAAGILVTETTGKAGWTGVIAVAAFVPSAVLGPLGGVLADRMERRSLLLATTVVQTVCAGLLAVLAARGSPSPAAMALIMFASGCVSALGFASYQAVLPDLVPREDLLAAISLSSAQWNMGRVIGPPLAGIAIAQGGYAWAFAGNTASFVAVIAALLAIRLPPPLHAVRQPLLHGLLEGARFARAALPIRAAIGSIALNSLLAGPFIALVPVMAIKVLHDGAGGTSVLVTAQGLGAVATALMLGGLAARFSPYRVLIVTMAALPPALLLYARSPSLWLAAAAIFILGGLYLSLLSGLSNVVQTCTPAALRGRVLSLHGSTLSTIYPLGSILQGTIADHFGLRNTTTLAALLLAAVLIAVRLGRPYLLCALGDDVSSWEK
jgi:MFS family permease